MLFVRPRGWHLVEKHVLVDGEPISGSLFDFGLYFFHNAKALLERGSGPYFYLPKMESHLEARLWNDVFRLRAGAARRAARHHPRHGADRNHSRRVRNGRDSLRTARSLGRLQLRPLGLHFQLHQEIPRPRRISCCPTVRWSPWTGTFSNPMSDLLIQTCHRRGIHAMGGMAAQIPIKNDPAANEARARKGAPGQAARSRKPVTMAPGSRIPAWCRSQSEIFDGLHAAAQPDRPAAQEVQVTAADLLTVPDG